MMSSLVADYGSSDDSNDSQNLSDTGKTNAKAAHIDSAVKPKKKKLLNPLLRKKAGNALLRSASVFNNPFLTEIDNRKSVLERHVKMTANPRDVGEINGKKVCWNHRRGKCRFGHNCKYAHQSDLATPASGHVTATANDVLPANGATPTPVCYEPPPNTDHATISSEDGDTTRKRKPGLSDSLLPNKRALKQYKKQQKSEQPWLR